MCVCVCVSGRQMAGENNQVMHKQERDTGVKNNGQAADRMISFVGRGNEEKKRYLLGVVMKRRKDICWAW